MTPTLSRRIEVKKIKHASVTGWNVLVVKTLKNGQDKIREKLVLSIHQNREITREARLREANDQARAVAAIFDINDVRLAGINDPADEAHEGDHS